MVQDPFCYIFSRETRSFSAAKWLYIKHGLFDRVVDDGES